MNRKPYYCCKYYKHQNFTLTTDKYRTKVEIATKAAGTNATEEGSNTNNDNLNDG